MKHTTPLQPQRVRRGFTLVELLTVVFIIAALIAILVPSISAARNQAKKVATLSAIDAISVGLQMFKTDNARDFPQTNGFPPSFAHPKITGTSFDPLKGEFPFVDGHPSITGAHWLPAMLMGVDQQGYISRKKVPKAYWNKAELWYTADGPGAGTVVLERSNLYVNPNNVRTVRTIDLRGRANSTLFKGGNNNPVSDLPVIVDLFDQPLLYYAANTHGRDTNMVEEKRKKGNDYNGGGEQSKGPPYYFHQDNVMFTGDDNTKGWDFGGSELGHAIARSGKDLTAPELIQVDADPTQSNTNTFAHYIVDRKLLKTFTSQTSKKTKLRPVNPDSFLLISAGVDGRYGTSDDPSNLPKFEE